MKTCVIRRRFWANEGGGTLQVDLEPGFGTPLACMIMFAETSATTNAFDTTTPFRSLGIGLIGSTSSDVSSTLRLHSNVIILADNSPTASARRGSSRSRAIRTSNQAGSVVHYDVSGATFANDRATFNFTTYAPQTGCHLETIMFFINGSDVIVGVGTHGMPATISSNSYTGLSFTPDCILGVSSISPTSDAGLTDDARLAFGAAVRGQGLKQNNVYWHYETTGAPSSMDPASIFNSNAFISYATSSSNIFNFTMSSFNSNGFTIASDATAAGSNNGLTFLAIKAKNVTDFSLVSYTTNTTTGNVFTGLGISGFIPRTVLGGIVNNTANATSQNTSPASDSIQFFAGSREADSLFFNGQGTITTSTANNLVAGTGTSLHRLAPGDRIYDFNNVLVGIVSSVGTATSATLTSNSAITLSTSNWAYSNPGQYCLMFGDEDGAGDSVVFSGIASSLITTARSTGGSPVLLEQSRLTNFDTRGGFNINTTASSGTARRGFVLAFANNESSYLSRRRVVTTH